MQQLAWQFLVLAVFSLWGQRHKTQNKPICLAPKVGSRQDRARWPKAAICWQTSAVLRYPWASNFKPCQLHVAPVILLPVGLLGQTRKSKYPEKLFYCFSFPSRSCNIMLDCVGCVLCLVSSCRRSWRLVACLGCPLPGIRTVNKLL